MKQDVSKFMFQDAFRSSQYKNNFSYDGEEVELSNGNVMYRLN